jgi:uncharacterized membrane protein YdbT with pleckstrin-like domain
LLIPLPTAASSRVARTVRYQGSTHLYFPGILLAVIGLATLILTWGSPQPYGLWVAIACLLIAVVIAVRAWWNRWTTEIFVTDRRVIFVHGFFARQSIEVHMNQIESVDVDQTLLGRLFGYGDVTIHGTGNTYDPLRAADRPIALRNEIIAR